MTLYQVSNRRRLIGGIDSPGRAPFSHNFSLTGKLIFITIMFVQPALHPRHVESSAVNWRLTHILRGQGAIFRLTCFNEGTLGSKNHLVSFKLLTILTDQGHIGYMFKTSPSPVFFRRGPEVRFFKKLTN